MAEESRPILNNGFKKRAHASDLPRNCLHACGGTLKRESTGATLVVIHYLVSIFCKFDRQLSWHLAPGTCLVCEIMGKDDSDKSESVSQGGCISSAPCMRPHLEVLCEKKMVTTSRCFSWRSIVVQEEG